MTALVTRLVRRCLGGRVWDIIGGTFIGDRLSTGPGRAGRGCTRRGPVRQGGRPWGRRGGPLIVPGDGGCAPHDRGFVRGAPAGRQDRTRHG